MARQRLSPEDRAAFERARADRCRQMGTLGGQETVRRYGPKFMAEIGKIGFDEYCRKHHNGNRAEARAALALATHPERNVRQPGPFARQGRTS